MSSELAMMAAFCNDREIHDRYFNYLYSLENIDRDIKLLLLLIHQYYADYSDRETIVLDDLLTYFDLQHKALRQAESLKEVIVRFFSLDVNKDLIQDVMDQIMEKHYAAKIFHMVLPVVEGHQFGVLPEMAPLVEGYLSNLRNPPLNTKTEECSLTLEEMLAETDQTNGLKWHLDRLNTVIGRLPLQTLGLIYAYVDSGKTSFALSEVANFALQVLATDETILYCGNEEPKQRLAMRLAMAVLRKNREQIKEDVPKYSEEMIQKGYNRIKLYDAINNMVTLRQLVDANRPRVVVIDQATKVTEGYKEEGIQVMHRLFNDLREMAKEFNTSIIGVAQGTGDAENKKFLKLSDIYGSRSAIQAELDYAIGIGRVVDDATKENVRYFNVPKNKYGENIQFNAIFDRFANEWREV